MAWTTPSTWASGDWNLQIRDNMTYMFNNLPPVGSVLPWAGGSTGPGVSTGWLPCDGRSLSTTGTYATLFGVVGYGFGGSGGSFNIPNMAGRSIFGVGWDGTGNSVNHAVSQGIYGVGGSNFGDHAHGLSGNANASTSTSIGVDGAHNHTFGANTYNHGHGFVSSGNVLAANGNGTSVAAPSHNHSFAASTFNHDHGWNNHAGHSHNASSSTSVDGTTSGVSSGYDTRPPFIGMYFIIRYV
jgi:hypothetical protein